MFNRLSWQLVSRLMSSSDCVSSLPVWHLLADTLRVLLEARRCGRPERDHKREAEETQTIVKGENNNMHKKKGFSQTERQHPAVR